MRTPINYGPITLTEYGDTDNGFVQVRGVVTDVVTGARLAGAVIEGLPNSPPIQANQVGYYEVVVPAEGTAQVTCSAPFYDLATVAVPLEGKQAVTQSFGLIRTRSQAPAIARLDSQYGRFFLAGMSVRNRVTAGIDWDVGQPKEVRIDKNGQVEIVTNPGATVSRDYDMGRDFQAGFASGLNRLEFVAENGGGQVSTPALYAPIIVPIPSWSEPLGSFQVNLGEEGQVIYRLAVAYPKEPIEVLISPQTLGSTLWNLWAFVPLVGGKNLGLKETQLLMALEYASSGEGKASLTGQTGLEIAGSSSVGHLTGEGLLQYQSGQGLVWTGVRVAAGLEVSVEKEEGLITIIPALQGAVRLPVIGRAIGWLNDRAKIKGSLASSMELGLELVRVPDGLDFESVDGTIGASAALGLEVEALRGLSVGLRGEGAGALTYQFPANPGYLKEATFELGGSVSLSAWLFEVSLAGSHQFSYPSGGGGALALASMPELAILRPVSRDFVTLGFNRVPRRLGLLGGQSGAAIQVLMENIYERSEPVLATHNGQTAVVWVVFNPDKPTLQATEIWFAFRPAAGPGSAYTSARAVTDNTQGDFAPTVAFDATGRLIAVWEQVKDPAFADASEEAVAAMAAQMEIVAATFDPGSGAWSVPVALTDDEHLDHAPQLRRDLAGQVTLFWLSNPAGLLVGDQAAPTRLHVARWDAVAGAFLPASTASVELIDCLGVDLAVRGDETTLVYARDGDGDLATAADANLFVATATGTVWTSPRPLTTDIDVADNRPALIQDGAGNPQLLWIRGDRLSHMPNLATGAFNTVRQGSGTMPFLGFQALRDPDGNVALLWQDQDPDGIDLFLSVFDAAAGAWSRDLRLTRDTAREMYPHAAFTGAGQLQVVFNQRPTPGDPNVDLLALDYPLQQDLAMVDADVTVTPAVYAQGDEVSIQATVSNTGQFAVSDFDVTLFLGDPEQGGTVLGVIESGAVALPAGATRTFGFDWTVPDAEASGRQLVFLRVDAQGRIAEAEEGNNTARHPVFRPDLVADSGQATVRPDGSLEVTARLRNQGAVKAEGIYIDFSASGMSLNTVYLPGLHPGRTAEVAYQGWLADLPPAAADITFTIDAEQLIEELAETNNRAWIAAPPDLDADRDGLPDWFEAPLVAARGGAATLADVLPEDDDDQDGSTNVEELEAGTDPLVAGSALAILQVRARDNARIEVAWQSVAGRTYRLEYSDNLRVWLPLEPPVAATGETTGATLDLASLAVPSQAVFVRVRLLGR
ncbi:MAG: hypothetical protein FJ387_19880 [Verrucomicrobia bacterium]|nr:hypothetical protein [Verrucomicrobiota bacterium]